MKEKEERKRREDRAEVHVCLFLRQQVGAAEFWHSPSWGCSVPHEDWWEAVCLSVCQHGHWGNGVKQISLTCAPMSALRAGPPLWLPHPWLLLLGDWRPMSRQAGEKHDSGGLR